MKKNRKIAAIVGAAAIAVTAGLGSIAAASGGEGDTPISGAALPKAERAALAETGEGRVTGTEVGDEDSYYEVEVTLADGSQVDVQLDKAFAVVKTMPDHEDHASATD